MRLLVALAALFPSLAAAQAEGQRIVAVFPLVARGGPPKALVDRINDGISVYMATRPDLFPLESTGLRARLKTDPDKALARCGDDVGCIVKLGFRAEAHEVILGRVVKEETQRIELICVDTLAKKVRGGKSVPILQIDMVESAINTALAELLGPPRAVEPVLAAKPPPAPPKPDPEPPKVSARPPEALPPAAIAPGPPRPWWRHSSGLFKAQVLFGVLGVAALGVGIYYGNESRTLHGQVKRDGDVNQEDAVAWNEQGNTLADRANLGFGVGAGLLAATGVLTALQFAMAHEGGR